MYTIEADLNDGAALRDAFSACRPTHVLHLAAQAGVRYAAKNPNAYVASNVAGFVSLLEAVRGIGEARERVEVPAVVYASSSSIYGLNTKARERLSPPLALFSPPPCRLRSHRTYQPYSLVARCSLAV